MPLLILTAITLFATYWTYRDATARTMAARRWAFAAAVTSGLSVPVYIATRRSKARA